MARTTFGAWTLERRLGFAQPESSEFRCVPVHGASLRSTSFTAPYPLCVTRHAIGMPRGGRLSQSITYTMFRAGNVPDRVISCPSIHCTVSFSRQCRRCRSQVLDFMVLELSFNDDVCDANATLHPRATKSARAAVFQGDERGGTSRCRCSSL